MIIQSNKFYSNLYVLVIEQSGVDDVRTILDSYRDEEDPVATFRRRQELLRETILEQQQKPQQLPSGGGGLFSGFFGTRVRYCM